MRVAFLADNQVDERSRLEEHDRVMDFITEDAAEREVDLVLHGGDIFERRSTVRERWSIQRWVRFVTSHAPLVVVSGNHEAAGEVVELGLLDHEKEILATEVPEVFSIAGAKVACLPWPRRSSLHAWLGKPAGHDEVEAAGLDAIRSILRGFADQWRGFKGPKILLAHCMVRGSKQGPDQPLVGQDFELGLEDLALAEATVNLLGHVHMPQEWGGYVTRDGEPTEPPTIYAGSPRRTAYAAGELEPKGYVVLEFEGDRLVQWERVPTPATPMVLIEAEYQGPPVLGFTRPDPVIPPGAEVRFRYQVDAVLRAEAAGTAASIADEMRTAGAAEVLVEEAVRPLSLARAPEVAAAPTLREQARAYWRAKGMDLGAAEERVLGRLARLEEEVPCS